MHDAAAHVVGVAAFAVVHVELGGGAGVLHQPLEQVDRRVVLAQHLVAEQMAEGEHAEAADRVAEQRVRAVEGVDVTAAVARCGSTRAACTAAEACRASS